METPRLTDAERNAVRKVLRGRLLSIEEEGAIRSTLNKLLPAAGVSVEPTMRESYGKFDPQDVGRLAKYTHTHREVAVLCTVDVDGTCSEVYFLDTDGHRKSDDAKYFVLTDNYATIQLPWESANAEPEENSEPVDNEWEAIVRKAQDVGYQGETPANKATPYEDYTVIVFSQEIFHPSGQPYRMITTARRLDPSDEGLEWALDEFFSEDESREWYGDANIRIVGPTMHLPVDRSKRVFPC